MRKCATKFQPRNSFSRIKTVLEPFNKTWEKGGYHLLNTPDSTHLSTNQSFPVAETSLWTSQSRTEKAIIGACQ
ncbi:UNVERIFIED_CONTAM: hypothetical protein FKN15_042614 [Acipenser sinensis]